MKMIRRVVIILLVGVFLAHPALALEGALAAEFGYLSGMTRQAMELSAPELETLVKRCDLALEQTDSLEASEKKVMRKKVERLRGLFLYVLQSKKDAKPPAPE